MSKQKTAIFYILIFLILILSASTSFLFTKNRQLQDKINLAAQDINPTEKNIAAQETSNIQANPSPSQTSSSAKVTPAAQRPSQPTDIYKVARGETLLEISTKNGVTINELSAANNLDDADKIQVDQNLIIPKNGQITFSIDNNKVTVLQSDVDKGKYQFRISPEETAKADVPDIYGLQFEDSYVVKEKDLQSGKASVVATHESKNYLIKLVQPGVKGEKGIWAVEAIIPGQ